jgi:hypothetical protein
MRMAVSCGQKLNETFPDGAESAGNRPAGEGIVGAMLHCKNRLANPAPNG